MNKSKLKKKGFILDYSSGGLNTNSGSEGRTAGGRYRKLTDYMSFTHRKQKERGQGVGQGYKFSKLTSRDTLSSSAPLESHNLS